jgi:hypothetical protein
MGIVRDGGHFSYYTDRTLKKRDQLVEVSCFTRRPIWCQTRDRLAKRGSCLTAGPPDEGSVG